MTSIRHIDQPATTSADDAYLDAARSAILAVGWSRTTLTDIARRAGVSRMTLYRRWPDTRALLADLMTREWAAVSRAGLAAHAHTTDGAVAQIAAAVVGTVTALRANPLLRRIIELDPELLLPYLLERRGRSQDALLDLLAPRIASGQDDGEVRAGDPVTIARALPLACHGFTLSATTMLDEPDGGTDALDAELARLVESYLRP